VGGVMSEIVVGVASSHSPQLSTPPSIWPQHAERDRSNQDLVGTDGEVRSFDELLSTAPLGVKDRVNPKSFEAIYIRMQAAAQTCHDALQKAGPSVVVVIGNDHKEMFGDDGMPAFAVYAGSTVADHPLTPEQFAKLPPDLKEAQWAYHSLKTEDYAVCTDLAKHILRSLVEDDFDPSQLVVQPPGRTLGHAWTYARRRIMRELDLPMVPIHLNANYPPNRPTPSRCYQFGRSVGEAIRQWNSSDRVAVIATGGLSHFVIDELLDKSVIDALKSNDEDALAGLPLKNLQSGTSEILNWVVAGGVLRDLTMSLVDYIPAYRSEAGTGVGMTFATWQP
jgi:hypothetical protein